MAIYIRGERAISTTKMTTQFRQHPGSACEECRRRKARCDRSRPRCGTCSVLGKTCVFNEQRTQRGPKKGQIRALRDRVSMGARISPSEFLLTGVYL